MFSLRTVFLSSCICLSICCLSACGGGSSDGAADAATMPVTLAYPNGRIMAVGQFATGTTTRVGTWQEYFDAPGSPQQWRRSYVGGTWDMTQDWREWNVNSSIRNDAGDH